MSINIDRIKANIKDFSFPRLSGTKFEEEAFEIAREKIKNLNLDPEIQSFEFSTFYSRIYPKIVFPLIFIVFLTLFLNPGFIISIVIFFISSLILLPCFILTRNPENIRIGKILKSQNLYVQLSKGEKYKSSNKNVFFIAHLDSKGQRFTARTRFLSILLWVISLIGISVLLILRNFFLRDLYLFLTFIAFFPLVVNMIGTFVLAFNKTNNKSKGVVDDASGVACVLELLNYYINREKTQPSPFNLHFVLTGAEETGTIGIRHFYELIKGLNKNETIVHNFESLGKSISVFISRNNIENNSLYFNLFQERAQQKDINTWVSGISRGVHTDGMYLYRKGFNLFEFGSTEVGKYMHSEKDAIENVDSSVLVKLCEFVVSSLSKFEEMQKESK